MAGWLENRALLSLVTSKFSVWVSLGPAEIAVAHATLCAPESSFTVWLAPAVKLGSSLTEAT